MAAVLLALAVGGCTGSSTPTEPEHDRDRIQDETKQPDDTPNPRFGQNTRDVRPTGVSR